MLHIQDPTATDVRVNMDGNVVFVTPGAADKPPKPRVAVRTTPDGVVTLTVDGRPFDTLTGMRVRDLSLKATPDGVRMVLDCALDTVEVDVEGGLRGLTRAPRTDPDRRVIDYLVDCTGDHRRVAEEKRLEAEWVAAGNEAADLRPGVHNPSRSAQQVVQEPKTVTPDGHRLKVTEFVCYDTVSVDPPDGRFVFLPHPGVGLTAEEKEKRDADAAATDGWRCTMPARYPILGDDGKQVGWSDGTPFVPVDFGTGDSGDETDRPIVVNG